jgi:hypothetical protein
MISRFGGFSPGLGSFRIQRPTGLVPLKYFFANVSLTRTTFGAAALSCAVKSRPATIGVP